MNPRPNASLGVLLPLLATALMGCPAGGNSPRSPATLTEGTPVQSPVQLIEWIMGPGTLAKPKSGHALLARVPVDKLKTNGEPTKLSGCLKVSSFLPDPRNDKRFFLVVDHALHVVNLGETKSTPLAGMPEGVTIYKLGAWREVDGGLELLAQITLEGKPGNFVYALLVKESPVKPDAKELRIVRSRIVAAEYKTIEEFLQAHTIARCTPDAKQCLKVPKPGVIDQHSRATGSSPNSMQLGNLSQVVDATWTPRTNDSLDVLLECAPNDGANASARQ